MVILVTCKNEEDPIKNEGTRVLTRYDDFSYTQGQLTRQSELESSFYGYTRLRWHKIVVSLNKKEEEYIEKKDRLPLLPARMKNIKS